MTQITMNFAGELTTCGVYMIRCRLTKRVYVGSSIDIPLRWREHRNTLRRGVHHSKFLQRAWDRRGEDNFEFFIIACCLPEDRLEVEQHWLDKSTCAFNGSRNARHGGPKAKTYEIRGRQMTARQIADEYELNLNTLLARVKFGDRGEDLIRPMARSGRARYAK